MKNDWNGNSSSVFTPLGVSSHSLNDRAENDYYATDPKAIDALFSVEDFSKYIWEPACGGLHLSKRMEEMGKVVINSDIVDRVDDSSVSIVNFLEYNPESGIHGTVDIITNPPYSHAQEFVEKALELVQDGRKVAMLLRINFLEGQRRKALFKKLPPKCVYVFSKRITCAKNANFEKYSNGAQAYAWFVWEKGLKNKTTIDWI